MIQASSIELAFGKQKVFDSISFTINEHQRIGLIGRNGSGKSTLLEAIVGLQQLDDGIITVNKNKKVAYLPQDVVLASSLSILDETMHAFDAVMRIQAEITELEKKIGPNTEPVLLDRYAHLLEQVQDFNIEQLESQAKKMLLGLGFKNTDFDASVATLSLGWRMRIVLAKLLLQKADFYLFDEPTNHLDIFAKDWFLDFLKNAPFGFLLVCHERYFLDTACDQILELEWGKATFYQGNYSSYLVQKEQARARLESAFVLQQKEIKSKEEIISKFKAGTRAKQAQSMAKQLEKIERIVLPPAPKSINFSFGSIARSGKIVITVTGVEYAFDQKALFKDVNFEIERGQKVALVASNGGGKTTLLNIIAGKLALQKGTVTFGSQVTYSIFDQDQNAALDGKKTILDNIEQACPPGVTTATVRAFLGAFLFTGDDVYKKVQVLSGGEKNRVGMVRVLLQHTNLLLLDEPTNHLDLESKQILLEALRAYEGTILFVSHDRAFLNDLATRIIELTPTGVISFMGNYDEYLYYKKQMAQKPELAQDSGTINKGEPPAQKLSYEAMKKSRSLEKKIDQLEKKIDEQEAAFARLVYGSAQYTEAADSLKGLKEQLQMCMAEWEALN